MADLDPIALAAAIAKAQEDVKKESVLSRFWTSVTGSDADPTVANMASANLGLPPAKAAEMTALLATTSCSPMVVKC